MNPLTLVKRIQSINAKEADLGISDEASWHAKYKDSAYVFTGGFPYDLTEGDLLAVFAQYGEIVDVNLVRDKATGKSKGFAFIAYEDQRSTVLAVDNLNGAQVGGRTVRVDHVAKYKRKEEEEEEDEETKRQKREERGVCRAFQKGECKYGDSCKFSHDKQRAADTGWGPDQERKSRAAYGRYDDHSGDNKRSRDAPPSRAPEPKQLDSYGGRSLSAKDTSEIGGKRGESGPGNKDNGDKGKRSEYDEEDRDERTVEKRSRYEPGPKKFEDHCGGREEMNSRRHDSQPSDRDIRHDKERDRGRDRDRNRDRERRAGDEDMDRDRSRGWYREKQSTQTKDYSYQHRRERENIDHREAKRYEERH